MPEQIDQPGKDGHIPADRRISTRGLERMPIFEQAEPVTLQIEVLAESYNQMCRIIEENGWERGEGLSHMLLAGLGYMDARLHLDKIAGTSKVDDEALARRVDDLVQDLASYHAMYAVLKYKSWKLYKLNQTLELNNSGLRATEQMWGEWAERMRREHAEMQTELAQLRARISEFKLDFDPSSVPASLLTPLEAAEAPLVQPSAAPAIEPDPPPPALAQQGPPQPTAWQRLRRWLTGQ